MNIHQFLTSYSYGDAIGNETLEIRDFLRKRGHNSEIFARVYHPRYSDQVINYLHYDPFSSKENIVIYHFSIGSPVTSKFLTIPDKKVMIYHNITPYEYYLDYNAELAKDCYEGRIELEKLAQNVELALGDSEYNERELKEVGYPNTGVLPLVMDFEKFERDDKLHQHTMSILKELFDDGKTNILFVGRIIPSKKIEDIIKTFHLYQKYFNPNSRLFLIGEYRGFERYLSALNDIVSRLQIKNIHFSGHIPNHELITYFKLSHLYLHMSEHEGFCAPIPECFYLNIPVIAYNAGAVKETMDNGGILVNQKDFLNIAATIDHILTDDRLKTSILHSQRQALEKYYKNKTGKILLDYLSKLTPGGSI